MAESVEMPFGLWIGWDQGSMYYMGVFVSDIAIFVLKRDVKLQLTN